ncbi:hypothetical protein [Paenibacillus sp. FSL L8-0708]|uniref:hypothetical protein n=1 Tax=Paenibacillus sp. FSL L8-0708 TaxID=2975311 RepID=UPI0030F91046
MNSETLTEALAQFDTLKRKPTKWEREAIARYVLAVEVGDIDYPEAKRRLTRGTAIMLGGQLLIKEHIKQLEEERNARMKKLEDLIFSELDRLNACYAYGSEDGFIVYTDKAKGSTVIYAEGFTVLVDDNILEVLRRLPTKAGAKAVYDALDPYEEHANE